MRKQLYTIVWLSGLATAIWIVAVNGRDVESEKKDSRPSSRLSIIPDTPHAPATLTDADYAEHVWKLKKQVPSEGFTIVVQRPFVVIGDERPAMVRQRAERTVKWAIDKLKEAYTKTREQTTPRPAISATISKKRVCCGSITTSSTQTERMIPPDTKRSKPY